MYESKARPLLVTDPVIVTFDDPLPVFLKTTPEPFPTMVAALSETFAPRPSISIAFPDACDAVTFATSTETFPVPVDAALIAVPEPANVTAPTVVISKFPLPVVLA